VKVLAVSGSLRAGSHNTSLLRAAAMSLPSGVELEVFDGLKGIPPYDADLEEGVGKAATAIDSGAALTVLEKLIAALRAKGYSVSQVELN